MQLSSCWTGVVPGTSSQSSSQGVVQVHWTHAADPLTLGTPATSTRTGGSSALNPFWHLELSINPSVEQVQML